ncbi:MAG: cupin domain-containing protein [Sphingorhabdus sp.]
MSTAADLAQRLVRNVHEVPARKMVRDPHYDGQMVRLSEGTAAQKLGASVYTLAPGKRVCPYHLHHAQEEMFVVLSGAGTLRVSGEMLEVRAGDVMFLPAGPEYPHQLINTSEAPMKYLAISTMEPVEIVEYPDSGKFMAEAGVETVAPFEVIDRKGKGLDYWDGEP